MLELLEVRPWERYHRWDVPEKKKKHPFLWGYCPYKYGEKKQKTHMVILKKIIRMSRSRWFLVNVDVHIPILKCKWSRCRDLPRVVLVTRAGVQRDSERRELDLGGVTLNGGSSGPGFSNDGWWVYNGILMGFKYPNDFRIRICIVNHL